MPRSSAPQTLTFHSKLESIATEVDYFAFSVPAMITKALKTRGPVAVSARLNGKVQFFVSLFPVGGGRHYMRVNVKARLAAKIKEGQRVAVKITVLDRSDVAIPDDLKKELRLEGVLDAFTSLSIGKQNHLIKHVDEAAKPETRRKRIDAVVQVAHEQREKSAARQR